MNNEELENLDLHCPTCTCDQEEKPSKLKSLIKNLVKHDADVVDLLKDIVATLRDHTNRLEELEN